MATTRDPDQDPNKSDKSDKSNKNTVIDAEGNEVEVEAPTRAVYPIADGEGGTAYAYGGDPDDLASYEEWAVQNGVTVALDEDGNPIDPTKQDPAATPQRRTDI